METGITQRRNAQMRSGLDDAFLRNIDFFSDGARLLSAVKATHRAEDGGGWGGGQLIEGFMADSVQANGMAATAGIWTALSTAITDWMATNYGGPYVWLSGNDALYITDAAWQEAGANNLFVWKWCLTGSLASSQTIQSKYDTNGNQCSWRLWFDSGAGAFSWTTNAGGGAGADVTLASTITPLTLRWFFIAGYFVHSTLMRIFAGQALDADLTVDDLAVGVPASVFNTTAPLTIGSSWNNFGALTQLDPWSGYIGVGHTRFNTPSGPGPTYDPITAYASRLFQLTKWFYRTPGAS